MTSNYQYNFTKKAETDLDEILSYIPLNFLTPMRQQAF